MKIKKDYIFKYSFDFSNNVLEEEKESDLLDNMINSAAIKELDNSLIDSEKKANFFKFRNYFYNIAIESCSKIKIKRHGLEPCVYIELKSKELNFNNKNIRKIFIDLLETKKPLNITSGDNGKIVMIAEFDLRKKTK